jgi:hypothetical protein
MRWARASSPGVKGYTSYSTPWGTLQQWYTFGLCRVILLSFRALAIMRPPCGTPHATKSACKGC